MLPEVLRHLLLNPPSTTGSSAAGGNSTAAIVTGGGGGAQAGMSASQAKTSVIGSIDAAQKQLEAVGMPEPMRERLADHYNASQQSAVAASLSRECMFTLVQGPPGTGKTSAILAIVSAFLADFRRGYMLSSDHHHGNQGTGGGAAATAARAGHGGTAGTGQYKKSSALSRRGKKGHCSDDAAARQAETDALHHPQRSDGEDGQEEEEDCPIKLGVLPPVRVLICAQSNAGEDVWRCCQLDGTSCADHHEMCQPC